MPTRSPRAHLALLAAFLFAAACGDMPTAPARPAPAARASLASAALTDPIATLDRTATSCSATGSPASFSCGFSVTELANFPAGADLAVFASLSYRAEYTCVNPHSGKAKAHTGGTVDGGVGMEWGFVTANPTPITDGGTLPAPTLPPGLCPKGTTAVMGTVTPTAWTVSTAVSLYVNGSNSYQPVDVVQGIF